MEDAPVFFVFHQLSQTWVVAYRQAGKARAEHINYFHRQIEAWARCVQAYAQVSTSYNCWIFVCVQPYLANIDFLILAISLSENLVKHFLLRSSACNEHLDHRWSWICIYQVKCSDQNHEVFVWSVACAWKQKCWPVLLTQLRQTYLCKKCVFFFLVQTFKLASCPIINNMYQLRVNSNQLD